MKIGAYAKVSLSIFPYQPEDGRARNRVHFLKVIDQASFGGIRSLIMTKKMKTQPTETLIGIVTPVQWNEDDRVISVALCATDDEQYIIQNGEKFISLIQKSIQATGTVKREQNSPKFISIKRFNILESF